MTHITPVVLCGGSGTRLWPLSREGFPKQFLNFYGKHSLYQEALLRLKNIQADDFLHNPPLIVTGEQHRFMAQQQAEQIAINNAKFILEPMGKNTAAALTMAALQATEENKDSVLLVTPSDQVIGNQENFSHVMQEAVRIAAQKHLVILGITPTYAASGYGYIQRSTNKNNGWDVLAFKEKPSTELAQTYLQDKSYSWNSGIFVLSASLWLEAIKNFRADIFRTTQEAWQEKTFDAVFIRPNKTLFASIPSESIDYAVMEKCPASNFSLKMLNLEAGWNDLGSWQAVWEEGKHDADGNVVKGDVLVENVSNSLLYADKMIAAVGVKDLIVIDTADALLVADKNESQNVKKIVGTLKEKNREEHLLHRKVYRPWGWYDSIDEGENFKVKRIQVNPKASLSLQKHKYRSEHWVVVKGTAEVTCGTEVKTLQANESAYIPLGEVHRLANPTNDSLEIIEVQSGTYLGEDDIIRLEDNYGRN